MRASHETSFDDWGSGLPVPAPVDAEASAWGAGAPPEMPEPVVLRETVEDSRIPVGQALFKIGEVAKIVGVKPYVLRYWESELDIIAPEKTDTRQRRYRREDVAMLLQVRRLRHEEKLSVARIRVLLGRSDDPAHRGPLLDPMHSAQVVSQGAAGGSVSRTERADLRRELENMREAVMELLEAAED